MSIITNFMGGSSDSDKPKKQAHVAMYCGICQEAYESGKDDFRITHCASCIESGRVRNADYWRQHFMAKQANTLSPDMQALFNKLADQRERKSLLEGNTVASRSTEMNGIRSRASIQAEQSKFAATLETVRSQVMEHLPAIVAELGLSGKIDIELVADMIVPAKVSSPIQDAMIAKAALRSIVMDELPRFYDTGAMLRSEASVNPKSKAGLKKTASEKVHAALYEGITRTNGTGYSRQFDRTANPMLGQIAPAAPVAPAPAPMPSPMDAMNAPIGEGAPGEMAMGMDPMEGQAEPEIVGAVTRVEDVQPEQTPLQQAMPDANGGGIVPNGDPAMMGAPELQSAPQDGSMMRVQQSAQPKVRIVKAQPAPQKPNDMSIFSLAGRVARNVPVQQISLDASAKLKLELAPIANYIQAKYSDGTTKTWNFYKTDKGGIFTSAGVEFYAEQPTRFAEFLATDPMFAKFAFLPEELQTLDDAQPNNLGSALPETGVPPQPNPGALEGGDPTINEIQPTVLHPAGENAGLMNDQDAIFNNQTPQTGGGADFGLDALLDTAADALPMAEQSFPNAQPEDHMNMALAFAADFLGGLTKFAGPENHPAPGEAHEQYLQRLQQTHGPGLQQKYKHWYFNRGKDEPQADLGQFLDAGGHNYQPGAKLNWGGEQGPDRVDQVPGAVGPGQTWETENAKANVHDLAHVDHVNQVAPPVKPQSPMGTVNQGGVDVPADKARVDQATQARDSFDSTQVKPLAPVYKDLSNEEPAGLPKLKNVENDPTLAPPPGAVKHLPSGRVRQPQMNTAASLEIMEVAASLTEDEFFSIGLPALVAAGYTDEEIMTVVAEESLVFGDYSAVTDVANPGTADEDAKRGLHNATDEDVLSQGREMMDAKVEK